MSKTDYNQHLETALQYVSNHGFGSCTPTDSKSGFVSVSDCSVFFLIQHGPVKENGRNGCDATDIIRYAIGLYHSFNKAHPCRENSLTITKLEEALHWQEARTRDREARQVEGISAD